MKGKRWSPKDYARKRTEGICVSCTDTTGKNPRTGLFYARCTTHRAMASRATQRYTAPTRSRWLARGCCVECGAPCGVNVETGKRFRRCLAHRLREAELHHAYRLRCDRVLAAVDALAGPVTQREIRRVAQMDASTCLVTVRRMVVSGTLERLVSDTGKRGRPSFLYQRRARQAVAA